MFRNQPILTDKCEQIFNQNTEGIGKTFGQCLRGCKWAPDGSCICTNSDDHRIRVFNLPQRFIEDQKNDGDDYGSNDDARINNEVEEIFPVLELKESQIIYDYCWYPFMNSNDYTTCFLLNCSRNVPIHMWDAYTGALHASYIAENQVCELVSARTISFAGNGTKILAGYDKFMCLFDVSRPGKYGELIYDIPQGIVSCLACNDKLFVTGTFSRLIGLYDPNSMENVAILQGHRGGLTHLMLSSDGNRLYSGARKDKELLCWDLRNPGKILHIIHRKCPTNQRIYFDIDFQRNILATGDDEKVKFYDLTINEAEPKDGEKEAGEDVENSKQNEILRSYNEFSAHQNRVNGVSLHPTLPLVGTTSGERCLLEFDETENDDIIFDYARKTYRKDNGLKLWLFN